MLAAKAAAEEELHRQEEEERRKEEEAERVRQQALKASEAAREAKKEKERLKREELRKQGKLLSKAEKERQRLNQIKLEQLKAASGIVVGPFGAVSDGESKKRPDYSKKKRPQNGSTTDKVVEEKKAVEETKKAVEDSELEDWEAALSSSSEDEPDSPVVIPAQKEEDISKDDLELEELSKDLERVSLKKEKRKELRSPICCILGHVDTGKTKLLDNLRKTNVQEGEAGGITQQIGATYFPIDAIKKRTAHLPTIDYEVPGLLVIDTPGHESFTNLRSRGSSLCNIAVLVVDIMHGLEPQTIESLNLLKMRKTPFIVALNKIDRLYGWTSHQGMSFEESLAKQPDYTQEEFETRLSSTILAFSEQGLNSEVSFRNSDLRRTVSLCPTSAITGDGVPDILNLLLSLTQRMMSDDLRYLSTLECTVLEVKVIEGLGTTIDVILSNGVLREGDRIAVCGMNGPITTSIRALLTPQPLREMRVKSQYVHHSQVKAALGVKISAADLDKAVAGSSLLVIGPKDDEEEIAAEVMQDLTAILESVDKSGQGVTVQASTIGSLEALLSFLKDCEIPVASINIGPVHKKDIIRTSVMLEQAREYACLLAFDVKIDKDAQDLAEEMGVKIFKADIIYHLFDQFTAYMKALQEQKRKDLAPQAVFPCVLKIVPGCVFNKRDPIICGVDVVEGVLRIGTPLCVPAQGNITIGRVTSIELNHKPIPEVRKGGPSVAIKIECASYETPRLVGRHFSEQDQLVSKISRASIDILKESFRNDLTKDDWALVVKLKSVFHIK